MLWGRCYEFERVLPYQPVAEALRTILPTLTPAELVDLAPWAVAEVARLVPEMAEHYLDLDAAAVAWGEWVAALGPGPGAAADVLKTLRVLETRRV
jgi:hypothetical protein